MNVLELDPRQFVKTEMGFLGDLCFKKWTHVYETRRVPESDEQMSGNVTVTAKIIEQGLRLQYPNISNEELRYLAEQQTLLANRRVEHIQIAMGGIPVGFLFSRHGTDLIHVGHDSVMDLKPTNPDRPVADAGFTIENGLGIGIKPADCPVLSVFHAPSAVDRRGVGMIHAGYVGMADGIIPKSFTHLHSEGFKPENMYVYIQPHANSNYTLHGNALDRIKAAGLQEFLHPTLDDSKMRFDMTSVVLAQLIESGINPDHVVVDNTDSMTSPTLYSHRAAMTGTNQYAGRNAIVVGMKPTDL